MAKKFISWKTKGMNRDTSVSAFNPEFAFENINLRLATNEGNTTMSWVNERGTKEMSIHVKNSDDSYSNSISGTPIGTAVLNHKLVIFTAADRADKIYILEKKEGSSYDLEGKILYNGNLKFNVNYPIETLVSYESEEIQKVYWTDNLNQPRVINIASSKTNYIDTSFDFVQELFLQEVVNVSKIFGAGEFPAGVIQYAFTYYNKYGQETNIFYTTPLQYISYVDRGGSADSKIANSFKITVSNLDKKFDYLRIYSILRTSVNGVPFVKRIQDIKVEDNSIEFIDDGLQGESVDPTELLYKGGEEIRVKTIEQKDGTLFLGNVTVTKPSILDIKQDILDNNGVTKSSPLSNSNITSTLKERHFKVASRYPFTYINTLTSQGNNYQGALGFKGGEYYRLGVQFQYKNGKWSEPCWIGDKQQSNYPRITENSGYSSIPEFNYNMDGYILKKLWDKGYRRIRPVFVVPGSSDKTILLQGVGCPTMFRYADRYDNGAVGGNEGILYAQASWLFRCPTYIGEQDATHGGGYISYKDGPIVSHFDTPKKVGNNNEIVLAPWLRNTEVMGTFNSTHTFDIDSSFITIHSPELQFDDSFYNMDFSECKIRKVGSVNLQYNYGDIDIQTVTSPIGSDAPGFTHRSLVTNGSAALISGLYYKDYLVDDIEDGKEYEAYNTKGNPMYFPIFMWHKNGSLNNDVSRTNRSAELLKKKISNYRNSDSTTYNDSAIEYGVNDMQFFNSDVLSVIKVYGHSYMGNIDTMVTPDEPSRYYFAGNLENLKYNVPYTASTNYYLGLADPNNTDSVNGVWEWDSQNKMWQSPNSKSDKAIGNFVKGLCQWRDGVSIKYKSTPHLVVCLQSSIFNYDINRNCTDEKDALALFEVTKAYNQATMFGGTSDESLKAASWIPCGPIKSFNDSGLNINIEFKWGDTYFQRFECLKTYAFTPEDKNQVVEIASFMVETRVNIDGRYDRNRAQTSNLNMSPKNFNLLNPIYSQMDNFFSYKILDDDTYKNVNHPNTITWTKTKENGAEIDLWTNITLANTMEMDGNKGVINKIIRMNNQLLLFQDSGIAQILYNENTQISTTEGVPIEIANSQKVQGKRYISDTVGCSNKWSITQTPAGIYFIDSNEKSIYKFSDQLSNISTMGGFNAWSKQNIPSANKEWSPNTFNNFVAYYDKLNQDVLFINKNIALAFSEKFNCFVSFYDYTAPFFENLDDTEIWIKDKVLWQHQAGDYCKFFNVNKPFSMTLVANQEPQTDKIFTNLEFRACVDSEGTYSNNKFSPLLPFDSLEIWNEYQHGILSLISKNGHDRFTHGTANRQASLERKFRMWRCDIPRDNAPIDSSIENSMGIKRFTVRPIDRIRNPWAYIKLGKKASESNTSLTKIEVHDIIATYYN